MRGWHVLLLAGASGSGKSSVAAALHTRYGVGVAEVDDILSAVTAMTTAAQYPLLHERVDPASLTDEEVVQWQLATARLLDPAVGAVIDTHLDSGPPVILEGDFLIPRRDEDPRVRCVVVAESDEQQLLANFAAREPTAGPQRRRARISRLHGAALAAVAEGCGVPVVAARPFATAADRVAAALAD